MNHTLTDTTPNFFGIPLSTSRLSDGSFPYEQLLGAIAVCFFRLTVLLQSREPAVLRAFFCVLLGVLAYTRKSYELIAAVELFSYVVPWLLLRSSSATTTTTMRLLHIAVGAVTSMGLSHAIFGSKLLWTIVRVITPSYLVRLLKYMFPVLEMTNAYNIMYDLALDPAKYKQMIHHLFFVTFHIQVGMGYLGINFLRKEQIRRNQLIRLDVADDSSTNGRPTENGTNKQTALLARSRRFQRSAAPFIFGTALPYMIQIIAYGNLNKFAFSCVQDEMHRTIRFAQVFEHANHLTAIAHDSATSPEAYASSMNTVVSTAYDMFNRKLFSLPKVMMLPAVMSKQPMLVLQVFPFIFFSDWIKASAVSYMTTKIEDLQKEIQELNAVRSKVESFDMKNAELLQRSGLGATQFTERRWESLTVKVQSRMIVSELLARSKGFFSFMQRNFVFTVLIDCALANLIAIGKIVTADIFVFTRAIEDTVDMMLMRSRGEAELARMMTEIEKLGKLQGLFEQSKEPSLLHCQIGSSHVHHDSSKVYKEVVLRNLAYSRGTAIARADHVELGSGVYALTGANGSGKSTLFRILMSCDTNEKSIDLPPSINMLTPAEPLKEEDDLLREEACLASDDGDEDSDNDEACLSPDAKGGDEASTNGSTDGFVPKMTITLPSSKVVEISQNFYWPLYSKPIEWIFQDRDSSTVISKEEILRVAEELHSLEFFQSRRQEAELSSAEDDGEEIVDAATLAKETIERIATELQEEKADWFGDLSGGQKSKVELTRIVFLRDSCPDVLLIDETFAPLDPTSKELVMTKLKQFCGDSIIIVIYHTDVGQGKTHEGKRVDCVPSNKFFDRNIHLENGIVHVRETC